MELPLSVCHEGGGGGLFSIFKQNLVFLQQLENLLDAPQKDLKILHTPLPNLQLNDV